MVTTVMALIIGVGLANIIEPGNLMSTADRARLLSSYEGAATNTVANAADAPSTVDQMIAIVPSNPFASLASGDMLQIIFFALMFGIALTMLSEQRSKPVVTMLDNCNEAMVMLVHIAMKLAPVGVAALLFKVVGSTGLSVLVALSVYGLVVIVGLFVHLVVTYGLIVKVGAKLPFVRFLKAIRPALLLAFSTSSSSATLPVTKECAEDNLNVSNAVSSFVIPLGATINMDGTALYQGVAALFIAQIYGMDLTLGDQASIVLSATLASVGAAGVPGAGMITLAMVLTTIGVPTEGLALVLGVDRLLDMFRTATNVVGDSAATVLMARLEGDDLKFLSKEDDATDPKKGFEARLDREPHVVESDVDHDE
jgi:Na+/H+-dicarboxylate symporter